MAVRVITASSSHTASSADSAVASRRRAGLTFLVRSSARPAGKRRQCRRPAAAAPVARRRIAPPAARQAPATTPSHDADTADARHRQGMELLRAGQVVVVRQVGSAPWPSARRDQRHARATPRMPRSGSASGEFYRRRRRAARMRACGRCDRWPACIAYSPPHPCRASPRGRLECTVARTQLPSLRLAESRSRSPGLRIGLLAWRCWLLAGARPERHRARPPQRQPSRQQPAPTLPSQGSRAQPDDTATQPQQDARTRRPTRNARRRERRRARRPR